MMHNSYTRARAREEIAGRDRTYTLNSPTSPRARASTRAEPVLRSCRLPTDRQGRSGFGLDVQQEVVQRHLASHAGELAARPDSLVLPRARARARGGQLEAGPAARPGRREAPHPARGC